MTGVLGLGVPGAGVPAGDCSFDGGCESPLGPSENVGGCFGWLEIAPEAFERGMGAVPAALSFLCGDADLCGVMTSAPGLT